MSHLDFSAKLLLQTSRTKTGSTRQSSVMSREEMLALKRRDDSNSHGQGELIVRLPELMRSFCFPVCTAIKLHTTGCVRFL